MSIKFLGPATLRLFTTLDSANMAIYGLADRASALATEQWWALISTSPTSAYTWRADGGAITGATGLDDALMNGIAYRNGTPALASVREWGLSTSDFVNVADGELFAFAVISYLNGVQPILKLAIRKVGSTALFTTERSSGGYRWSNAKVYLGAGSGDMFQSRMRFSKISVLNVGEPDDSTIIARFDALSAIDGKTHSHLTGFGADLSAAIQDSSGNANNWQTHGLTAHIVVDNAHASATTEALIITGNVAMPDVLTQTDVPAAPSGLAAEVIDSQTIRLTFTDNSADEAEFVAQVQKTGVSGPGFIPWTDIASQLADITTIDVGSLLPGTAFEFRVRAQNPGGRSAYSNIVSAATPGLFAEGTVEPSAVNLTNCKVVIWLPPTDPTQRLGVKLAEKTGNFEAVLVGGAARIRVPIISTLQGAAQPLKAGDPLIMHVTYAHRTADEQQSVVMDDALVVEV